MRERSLVVERVEGTCDDSKGLMYYNYRRGTQSILFKNSPAEAMTTVSL